MAEPGPMEQAVLETLGESGDPVDAPEAEEGAVAEEGAEETGDEESQEEEPSEEEPEKEPPTEPSPEDLFTDEALETKEGILKAKEHLLSQRKQSARSHARLERKARKLTQKVKEFRGTQEAVVATRDYINRSVHALRQGGARERLHTLAQLMNLPPDKAYEQLSIAIATDGKGLKSEQEAANHPAMRKVAELERKLEERAQAEKQREEQWRAQQEQVQLQKLNDQLLETIKTETVDPIAAAYAGQSVEKAQDAFDWCVSLIESAHANGRRVTFQEAAKSLGAALNEHGWKPPAARDAAPARGKPGRHAARSLSPGKSGPAKKQELTESDRVEAIANDPSFFNELGIAL